jgi:hypothetical protein
VLAGCEVYISAEMLYKRTEMHNGLISLASYITVSKEGVCIFQIVFIIS